MSFTKKYALTFFVVIAIVLVGFLLWYHCFPVKVFFDNTLYSESGNEVKIEGELQYYRSIFSNGGKTYGEVVFNGAKYSLPVGGPYGFVLYNAEGKGNLNLQKYESVKVQDSIIINFTEKDYGKNYFVTENVYPFKNAQNYFLTKPNINTKEESEDNRASIVYNGNVLGDTIDEKNIDNIKKLPGVIVID